MFAEYIVATALDCHHGVRMEWDAYDVQTPNGIKVEVKSGAYLQSWDQSKLSVISFGIRPTFGWDYETNKFSTEKYRQADVYVFCVLNHQDKTTVDPLNLAQWDFYILGANTLDSEVGNQKTIVLSSLLRLGPKKVGYDELAEAVLTSGCHA
jgi:hypothetical protein